MLVTSRVMISAAVCGQDIMDEATRWSPPPEGKAAPKGLRVALRRR
jgi:hypothetical protein